MSKFYTSTLPKGRTTGQRRNMRRHWKSGNGQRMNMQRNAGREDSWRMNNQIFI